MAADEGVGVDLRGDGVLWLINRVVFHPRGFALGVDGDGKFTLLGDGSEVWTFTEGDDDAKFAAVEALMQRARHADVPQPAQPTVDLLTPEKKGLR